MTVFARISAFLFESARLELISKQFGFTIGQLEGMLPADPTGGKYLTWIAKQAKLGQLRFPEDQAKVHQRLTQFDQLKKKPQFTDPKDLNQYKTYSQLAQTIEANLGIQTKGEVRRQKVADGAKLIKEWDIPGKKLAVYEISTFEALDAMGAQRTEWCVKDQHYFNSYGPPYYLLTKNDAPSKLLHIGSRQCMDEWDSPTGFDEFEHAGINLDELYTWDYLTKRVDKMPLKARPPFFDKAIDLMKLGILEFDTDTIANFMEEQGAGQELGSVGSWDRKNGWRELEQTLIETVQGRYPDRMIQGIGHKALATYAGRILKSRWKEAEEAMLAPTADKGSQSSGIYWYTTVIRADETNSWGSRSMTSGGPKEHVRWPEAEQTLIDNCFAPTTPKGDSPAWWAVTYALNMVGGRWDKLEEAFLKLLAAEEADFVSDIDLEEAIDSYNAKLYRTMREGDRVLRIPFPDTRKEAIELGAMKPDGNGGYVYNLNVFDSRRSSERLA